MLKWKTKGDLFAKEEEDIQESLDLLDQVLSEFDDGCDDDSDSSERECNILSNHSSSLLSYSQSSMSNSKQEISFYFYKDAETQTDIDEYENDYNYYCTLLSKTNKNVENVKSSTPMDSDFYFTPCSSLKYYPSRNVSPDSLQDFRTDCVPITTSYSDQSLLNSDIDNKQLFNFSWDINPPAPEIAQRVVTSIFQDSKSNNEELNIASPLESSTSKLTESQLNMSNIFDNYNSSSILPTSSTESTYCHPPSSIFKNNFEVMSKDRTEKYIKQNSISTDQTNHSFFSMLRSLSAKSIPCCIDSSSGHFQDISKNHLSVDLRKRNIPYSNTGHNFHNNFVDSGIDDSLGISPYNSIDSYHKYHIPDNSLSSQTIANKPQLISKFYTNLKVKPDRVISDDNDIPYENELISNSNSDNSLSDDSLFTPSIVVKTHLHKVHNSFNNDLSDSDIVFSDDSLEDVHLVNISSDKSKFNSSCAKIKSNTQDHIFAGSTDILSEDELLSSYKFRSKDFSFPDKSVLQNKFLNNANNEQCLTLQSENDIKNFQEDSINLPKPTLLALPASQENLSIVNQLEKTNKMIKGKILQNFNNENDKSAYKNYNFKLPLQSLNDENINFKNATSNKIRNNACSLQKNYVGKHNIAMMSNSDGKKWNMHINSLENIEVENKLKDTNIRNCDEHKISIQSESFPSNSLKRYSSILYFEIKKNPELVPKNRPLSYCHIGLSKKSCSDKNIESFDSPLPLIEKNGIWIKQDNQKNDFQITKKHFKTPQNENMVVSLESEECQMRKENIQNKKNKPHHNEINTEINMLNKLESSVLQNKLREKIIHASTQSLIDTNLHSNSCYENYVKFRNQSTLPGKMNDTFYQEQNKNIKRSLSFLLSHKLFTKSEKYPTNEKKIKNIFLRIFSKKRNKALSPSVSPSNFHAPLSFGKHC